MATMASLNSRSACNSLNLQFNVSHSHAVSPDCRVTQATLQVGIDIEQVNSHSAKYIKISANVSFAEAEHQALIQQPVESAMSGTFFQLWTRKEACVKAMGGSIAHAFDQITCGSKLNAGAYGYDLSAGAIPGASTLSVHTLTLIKDCASAVATTQAPSSTLHVAVGQPHPWLRSIICLERINWNL